MTFNRVRALALALLMACAPSLSLAQSQPAPTAKQGTSNIPRDTQPVSIFAAPSGGGYGPGKVVSPDNPLPISCLSGCSGSGGGSSPFAVGGNATLTAGTTTSRVALPTTDATVVIVNNGVNDVAFKLGGSSVTAATTDAFLGAGRAIAVARGTATYLAAITGSSTSALQITTGTGQPVFSGGGGSSGGGGTTVTANAAAPSWTEGSSTNPLSGDLHGSLRTTVLASDGSAVDWTATVPVSAASLPLPTGAATAAKQPALGTAGTPSSDVLSIQGVTGGKEVIVGGNVAGATADSGNPVKVGAIYNLTIPTYADGSRTNLQTTSRGEVLVTLSNNGNAATVVAPSDATANTTPGVSARSFNFVYNGTNWDRHYGNTTGASIVPYGLPAKRWSYAAASGGILNTTTAVTIKAAGGASVKNCLVSLDIMAEPLGAATELVIRDGAAGTVLWRTKIGTAGIPNGRQVSFPAAICGTANTLMEVATLTATTTGAIYVNAVGDLEP